MGMNEMGPLMTAGVEDSAKCKPCELDRGLLGLGRGWKGSLKLPARLGASAMTIRNEHAGLRVCT